MTEDEQPYCPVCGEEDALAFLGTYANGCEYQCRRCGHTFMQDDRPTHKATAGLDAGQQK